jgi:hypothetical protein
VAAFANNVESLTTGLSGNAQLTHISPLFAPTIAGSGNVRVSAMIAGSGASASDPVAYELLRDPLNSHGAPGGTALTVIGPDAVVRDTDAVSKTFSQSLEWIDHVNPGATHSWAITAVSLAGNHLAVPSSGASIILSEVG